MPSVEPPALGRVTPATETATSSIARLRRLHLIQLVAMSLLALLASTVIVVAGRAVDERADRLVHQLEPQREIGELRDRLRGEESAFWRLRAEGKSGLPPRFIPTLFEVRQQTQKLAADANHPRITAAARGLERDIAEVLVLGVAYVRATPAEQERILQDALPLVDTIRANAELFYEAYTEQTLHEARAQRTVIRQSLERIGAILAVFLLTGGALWILLARGRRRLLERIGAAAEADATLGRVATVVAREAYDPITVFTTMAREAAVLLGAHGGGVYRFDNDVAELVGSWVSPEIASPDEVLQITLPLNSELALGQVARTRAPARVSYTDSGDPIYQRLAALGYSESVAAPIPLGDGLWGAIGVAVTEARELPSDAEALLTQFAALGSMAIANAEARAQLTKQASADPLTGLPNHRSFHEALAHELIRCRRYDHPLTLVVLDIDHFKAINDTFGHQAGDTVLVEVAHRLDAQARSTDTLARVGGEEFAWILPETDAGAAAALVERARGAMAAHPFGEITGLTISAGLCDLTQATTPGELFRLADAALIAAKNNGRDALVVYNPETVSDLSADDRVQRLERARTLTAVRALARAVDARDRATQRHSERVAALAFDIAIAAGWSQDRADELREAALVHDVGKIGVSDAILTKPGPLTDDEFAEMKTHPALGAQVVSEVLTEEQVSWVRSHHERLDGTGYPDGLVGDEIPDGGRILAVADAWDAMTSDRSYRGARSSAEALAEFERCRGTQFDPVLIDHLRAVQATGVKTVSSPDLTSDDVAMSTVGAPGIPA